MFTEEPEEQQSMQAASAPCRDILLCTKFRTNKLLTGTATQMMREKENKMLSRKGQSTMNRKQQ